MNRYARVLAIQLLLAETPELTVTELAVKFGVCPRTIQRDLKLIEVVSQLGDQIAN